MATHLTLIRCPSAFAPNPCRQGKRGAGDRSPIAGHWNGPARLTTPDATGRRFVLSLIRSSAPAGRPDPGRRLNPPA